MTLDEEINRFEKLASDYEFNLNMHKNHVMNLSVNDIERMQGHLEENRQLAKWLRELKKYRAIFEKVGKILANNGFTIDDLYAIYVKTESKEVNADDTNRCENYRK